MIPQGWFGLGFLTGFMAGGLALSLLANAIGFVQLDTYRQCVEVLAR